MTPNLRSEMLSFLALNLTDHGRGPDRPGFVKEVLGVLWGLSDGDLSAVLSFANTYAMNGVPDYRDTVVALLRDEDLPTFRIVAAHATELCERTITIPAFHMLLRHLERAGLMPRYSDDHPSLSAHITVAKLSVFNDTGDYLDNEKLVVFVEENHERVEEIVAFMHEHSTDSVGLLRQHFFGDPAALESGRL